MEYAIFSASGPEDRSWCEPLIREVFEDILKREYRYGWRTRELAVERVVDIKSSTLRPMLRDIALLELRPVSEERLFSDVMAVMESLNALTLLRDPQAVALNRKRLGADSWINSAAISNLALLKAWEATAQIQEFFDSLSLSEGSRSQLASALGFLADSPETGQTICPRARAVADYFGACVANPNDSYCDRMSAGMNKLKAGLCAKSWR